MVENKVVVGESQPVDLELVALYRGEPSSLTKVDEDILLMKYMNWGYQGTAMCQV